jgi:hypothetical protein
MRIRFLCHALLLGLLLPVGARAQARGQITGLVRSETGVPVPGAEVTVVGTQLRAITAVNGRYTL